jgi:hypothetical protein
MELLTEMAEATDREEITGLKMEYDRCVYVYSTLLYHRLMVCQG